MDHRSVAPTSPYRDAVSRAGWPRTLRARLALSHALVLLLALLLALALSAALLVRESRRAQVEQLEALAVPLMVEAAFLAQRPGFSQPIRDRLAAEVLRRQASELGVRLLLLAGDGRVRHDTGAPGAEPLPAGTWLAAYRPEISRLRTEAAATRSVSRSLVESVPGEEDPFPGQRVVLAASPLPPAPALAVVAPPARPLIVGRLAVGFGVVLVVSLGVATLSALAISRVVAAPVTALAAAADAMAAGTLEQAVPGEGPDEISRLVERFNAMSRRIAAVDRSQRRLLANVAHELRTPLTSVQGYARALRDGVVNGQDERERALRTVEVEAGRMGRLVTGLLDLARLESGQARLDLGRVEVGPALERLRARFARQAEERGVDVRVAAPAGLAVLADDDRLAQVFGNLVDNALRHTPRGGEVALLARQEATGWVVLSVQDNGVGMGGDRLEHLFEPFLRGTGEHPGEGFGLGLAIVREIVTAHGGTVELQSGEGRGTTVTVRLPAAL